MRDYGTALPDEVVVIAVLALPDYCFIGFVGGRFHTHKHLLDIARRNAVEYLRAQHHGHPVAIDVLFLLFLHVDFRNHVTGVLVPGEEDIEQIVVDTEKTHIAVGDRGALARTVVVKGKTGRGGTADDSFLLVIVAK